MPGTRARGPDPQSRRQRKSPAAGPPCRPPSSGRRDGSGQDPLLQECASCLCLARPKIDNYSIQLDMHAWLVPVVYVACSARTPGRAGLLQADADRRGPTLFLAGDWVPCDVVAMPWYAGQQSLSLQELNSLTAGLTRVSMFLAERGYRWQGRPDTRSPLMICSRIRSASRTYDRGSASPGSTDRFMGIPPCRRPITLVHGRLVS